MPESDGRSLTVLQGQAGEGEEDEAGKDDKAAERYGSAAFAGSSSGHEEYGVRGRHETSRCRRRGAYHRDVSINQLIVV